jgi:hypothetical protein
MLAHRRRFRRSRAFLAIAVAASLAIAGSASAKTFTVNDTAADSDVSPGDGICATAGGNCTLRAAVTEANALPGADTILVRAGHYEVTSSALALDESVTIKGAGAAATVIEGAGSVRIFTVNG